jgi:HPt (histidine-containing phosphotransfer) domain-containing protein
MTTEGPIDEKVFAAFQEEIGDMSFVVKMIDIFLAYFPKLFGEAKDGLAKGDLEPVVRMGHSLRTSGRYLGATRIADLAQSVEMAGRAGKIDLLPSLLDQMETAYACVKDSLENRKMEMGT